MGNKKQLLIISAVAIFVLASCSSSPGGIQTSVGNSATETVVSTSEKESASTDVSVSDVLPSTEEPASEPSSDSNQESISSSDAIYLPSAEELMAHGVKDEEGVSGIDDPGGHPVYKVTIENIGDLADTEIQLIALDYIEPYLHEYLNYYQPDGKYYYAKYVEDSYIESYNIPRFNVYIEELDLEIECMCILSEHYYRFKSRFNPDWE